MSYISEGSDYHLQEVLVFNSKHFTPEFIEKLLEITTFAIRFYKEELRNQD